MHTVTKILVVFAAVLCVLLAALTMAYSVNAERIVANYQAQVLARQAAEESAAADKARAQAQMDELRQQIAALQNQVTNLTMQKNALDAERAQLIAQARQAEAARESRNAQIDQLAATARTQALLIESYRSEVTRLRENELAFRRREIELEDRLNDLESLREVHEANIRALQEQLVELRRTIETQGAVATGAAGPGAPYTPSIPISGTIVKVGRHPATGKPVATINVGTNNQVRENMRLVIYRGGQFLGNLLITRADLQWSVGEIDTLNRPVDIREGDSVGTLVSR